MDVNLQPTIVNHVVENTSTIEKSLSQRSFVEIMNREMNWFDTSLFIHFAHLWPVDSSVIDIDISLDIENCSHSSFHHHLSIFFQLGIGTNEYVGISNKVKSETTNEVGISFLNVAVYKEYSVDIPPHVRPTIS